MIVRDGASSKSPPKTMGDDVSSAEVESALGQPSHDFEPPRISTPSLSKDAVYAEKENLSEVPKGSASPHSTDTPAATTGAAAAGAAGEGSGRKNVDNSTLGNKPVVWSFKHLFSKYQVREKQEETRSSSSNFLSLTASTNQASPKSSLSISMMSQEIVRSPTSGVIFCASRQRSDEGRKSPSSTCTMKEKTTEAFAKSGDPDGAGVPAVTAAYTDHPARAPTSTVAALASADLPSTPTSGIQTAHKAEGSSFRSCSAAGGRSSSLSVDKRTKASNGKTEISWSSSPGKSASLFMYQGLAAECGATSRLQQGCSSSAAHNAHSVQAGATPATTNDEQKINILELTPVQDSSRQKAAAPKQQVTASKGEVSDERISPIDITAAGIASPTSPQSYPPVPADFLRSLNQKAISVLGVSRSEVIKGEEAEAAAASAAEGTVGEGAGERGAGRALPKKPTSIWAPSIDTMRCFYRSKRHGKGVSSAVNAPGADGADGTSVPAKRSKLTAFLSRSSSSAVAAPPPLLSPKAATPASPGASSPGFAPDPKPKPMEQQQQQQEQHLGIKEGGEMVVPSPNRAAADGAAGFGRSSRMAATSDGRDQRVSNLPHMAPQDLTTDREATKAGVEEKKEEEVEDEEPMAVVGKSMTVRGVMECGRATLVEGSFEGEVISTGDIIVAAGGSITGDLKGLKFLLVKGQVVGDVMADKVMVLDKGKVIGDMAAITITIGPEATMKGRINVVRDNEELEEASARMQAMRASSEEGVTPNVVVPHGAQEEKREEAVTAAAASADDDIGAPGNEEQHGDEAATKVASGGDGNGDRNDADIGGGGVHVTPSAIGADAVDTAAYVDALEDQEEEVDDDEVIGTAFVGEDTDSDSETQGTSPGAGGGEMPLLLADTVEEAGPADEGSKE